MTEERGVEVYGHYSRPRVKWTCKSCGKRNDNKLSLPVSTTELFWCKFCKKRTPIAFTIRKQDEP